MNKADLVKVTVAVLILGVAGFFLYRFFSQSSGVSEKAFFYDESAAKLFTAARTSVPPIKGMNGPEEDGMRAVVISTTGKPEDRSSWKVAYLEKYSAELKQQMEAAQKSGGSPQMGRVEATGHRFVRRVNQAEWFPMSSAEGEKIVTEWATPGPDGITPVVCAP